MKLLFAFGLITVFNMVLFTCEDCTAIRYQVIKVDQYTTESGQCMERYKTRAFTDCAVWRDHDIKIIKDTCGTFVMSDLIPKEIVESYQ